MQKKDKLYEFLLFQRKSETINNQNSYLREDFIIKEKSSGEGSIY